MTSQPPSAFPRKSMRAAFLTIAAIGIGVFLLARLASPTLPVAVTFRPAIDGNSLVAQLHNTSSYYVPVRALFEDRGRKQHQTRLINIGPYQTAEYGWLEGWSFMSGERITLSAEGYRTVTVSVP